MNNISSKIIRYSWVVLFLWFGYQQLADPHTWVGFLPTWTGYFPVPAEMLVQLNGWVEIIGAIFLLSGSYIKIVAAILSLHLLGIAWEAGGAIGMRDLILAMMGIAMIFDKPDTWTLDAKRGNIPLAEVNKPINQ